MSDARTQDPEMIGPARLHPVWIISAFISGIRNSIALFIGVGLSLRSQSGVVLLMGLVVLLALILGYRVLQWMRISYEAANDAVAFRSGLFTRFERIVPVERIQNVNTIATPIDRLFGTLQLAIETAGSGDPLTLETLSRAQASELQAWIDLRRNRHRRAEVTGDQAPRPADAEPAAALRLMSSRELLVAGLTSGRVGPALAVIAAGFRFATDLLPERYWQRLPFDPDNITVTGIVILLVFSALIAWTLSVISAFVVHWQFTLTSGDDAISIESGLLDRRHVTIPRSRIQAISIVESPLRQPFGYASVMIESASRFAGESDDAGSQTLIPIIRRSEIPDLLERAVPDFMSQADPRLEPLPRQALRRYLVAAGRTSLVLICIAIAVCWLLPFTPWWYGLGLLPLAPIMLLYGYTEFQDAGWAIDASDRIIIRRRSIDRITTIAPRRRVQLRSLTQSPFQRRADLATMSIKLAGRSSRGTMTLVHIDEAIGRQAVSRTGPRDSGAIR
jgi:putative membrane protein